MFKSYAKKLAICLIPLLLLILFSPYSASFAGEKTSLRLGWVKDIMTGGPIVAKEKGFFKDRNIDMEIRSGGFELDPIKLVVSGSDTFGVTGADSLLTARSKGIPIVAVGVEYQRSPICLISRKKEGITHPKDLIGKKVGVKYATDAETVYDILLKKHDVNRDKIHEIPVKWDLTPFLTGRVDVMPGYIINEPRIARNKGLEIDVMAVSDFGIHMYGNVYFTTEKTLREKPELVESFLAAVIDGWWHVFRHKEDSIQSCLNAGKGLDKTDQSEIYDLMLPLFVPENGRFCWMTLNQWQETHDLLYEVGLFDTPLKIEEAFDMNPLKAVYK
jgi:NitT/TauT family transport system substrate-binding protein